jgi:MoxR-like ATPase
MRDTRSASALGAPAVVAFIRDALQHSRQLCVIAGAGLSTSAGVPDFVSDQLSWGAGPRAVQFLVIGSKARALLQGRSHVTVEDIQALVAPVLRHRIVVGFAAESDGVTPDAIIRRIIENTPVREDELTRDPRFQTIFAS